ncbi:MAG: hypothetical protein AABZ53_06160, partial [Planctomycetota bacterium]
MTGKLCRILVASAALCAAGAVQAQTNVLVNPGFETTCGPAANWETFGGNVSSINFYQHSGGLALK